VVDLKESGYHVVAVELCEGARPYHEYAYPKRTCLVVGNEDHGVTRAMLELCDAAVFLPMYGKGLSLNVHVALSIVVYHIIHSPQI
jgi:tRNA (guanosine-2'-O-)-methyltransferase